MQYIIEISGDVRPMNVPDLATAFLYPVPDRRRRVGSLPDRSTRIIRELALYGIVPFALHDNETTSSTR